MSRDPEWSIDEEIRALVWFTRALPLLTLFVVGLLQIAAVHATGWLAFQR